jgi:hypothetical protein
LENLFVLSAGNIFWVMMVALMLAWSLLVVSRLVLLNGTERFAIDQCMQEEVLTGRHLLLASVPTVSLFVCAFVEKERVLTWVPWWKWVVAAVGGAMIAYAAGFLALVLSVTLAPRYHPDDDKYDAERRYQIPFFYSKRLLRWADGFRLIRLRDPDKFASWVLRHVPVDLRSGYADSKGHLYPGHWLGLNLFIIALILYVAVGAFRGYRLGMPTSVPAVTYVLILMLVINWVLSTSTFFLDRYRIPLVLPIALFCTFAGQFPQSDHYFPLRDGVSISPVSAGDALASHSMRHPQAQHPNGGVIVIATAGGGIQAAGWTARVLTGLHELCSAEYGTNFADSIAAISAVSGGAVGTLFFMNQYSETGSSPGFHATPEELKGIVDKAETPALSDVAWSIAYVEPLRVFLPYWKNSEGEKILDRGFVLEQTWRNQGSIYAYLSNWREGVVKGWRPAVIFNATIAETGQPFLLSTSDFDTGSEKPARQTLIRAYPNSDLPVVTATRLAASFPYVSPASRPLSSRPEYHVVDGGYFDNFGVDSLIAWLDQGLSSAGLPSGKKPDVLFIQIRSFPTDAFLAPESRGWFYQSYAPLNALMSVRTTAQLVRDREELELLKHKWLSSDDVRIEVATFEFSGKQAPLSWELTAQQKSEIQHEWEATLTDPSKKEALDKVRSFCSPQ